MKINFKNVWNYLPILNLYVEIPFISVRTSLMNKSYETRDIQYIMLDVKFFKWSFSIKLYDIYRRYRDRDNY